MEADIALSDAALGLLALILALHQRMRFQLTPCNTEPPIMANLYRAMQWILLSTVFGAWLGAYWHAFLANDPGLLAQIIWRLTLVAIGCTAYGFALFGLYLLRPNPSQARPRPIIRIIIPIILLAYLTALLIWEDFLLAIVVYLPAVLFAMIGFTRPPLCSHQRLGITGLGLILIASAYQQWGPDIHPQWLTHNAVYHLLLMLALLLFYQAVRLAVMEQKRP